MYLRRVVERGDVTGMRVNWRVLRLWINVVAAILAAASTFYLGYIQSHPGYLTKQTTGPNPHAVHTDYRTLALSVLATVALGTALARPLRALTTSRIQQRRDRVKAAMRGLPWTVHDTCGQGVPVREIGASAWLAVNLGRWSWLYRLSRERFSPSPQASNIRWSKGKGVIGQCWRDEREKIINTEDHDKHWTDRTQTEWDNWTGPGFDTRMGLSWAEFQKITGKYGTVVAVPIKDGNEKVIGVVAVDGPPGYHVQLACKEVKEDVTRAAALVAQLLGRG